MGWSLGYDSNWKRDIGYGVPAYCDYPGCGKEIDRGLGYVCGGEPYGGDEGCGLFFCGDHLSGIGIYQQCERCRNMKEPFEPTPDHPNWINHKLTDPSWQQWRDENPTEVEKLQSGLTNAPSNNSFHVRPRNHPANGPGSEGDRTQDTTPHSGAK